MSLIPLLKENQLQPTQVIQFEAQSALKLDLSKNNIDLVQVDMNDERQFTDFVFNQLKEANAAVGCGGYGEERSLYSRSDLFSDDEPRTFHLGIDIWAPARTPVYAPLDAIVHSVDNRAYHGDYGPVIILEHQLGDQKLFSLYGHLSVDSLDSKVVGQEIKKGEQFAWLGAYKENFHWPPHLHFQLMWDMQGHVGDYPGVCKASEKEGYLTNCPDPENLLF